MCRRACSKGTTIVLESFDFGTSSILLSFQRRAIAPFYIAYMELYATSIIILMLRVDSWITAFIIVTFTWTSV